MNEQTERATYGWLGYENASCEYNGLRGTWLYTPHDMHHLVACPPLDMKTWHGEVEKKLAAAGVSVVTIMYTPTAGGIDGRPYTCSIDCAVAGGYGGVDVTAEAACYAALLDCIKGV